ncbi:MFS transporter [Paenibacillus protaetiae]|uniref:MFS transporter n=1 Tax=Paenibacillus protaetiae TaxID=2509456 RepID=A0A4P6EU23_9BACL|nr:MFS transporter [Paenibacillus protaetiae]QAY66414.1 MFS transporter [Paenibacillus protaetiae]
MDLSASVQTKSASAKKETLALRGYTFAVYTTQAVVTSFLPLYFLDGGYSEQQIGLLYSTGPIISIVSNLIMGLASDRYRTVKKLLILLLFGQLAAMAALFPAQHFAVVCLIMAAFYFFQTPMNPLTDSMILLSSQYTKTPYALIRIFGSLGFALAAYFLGLVLKATGPNWTLPLAWMTISLTLILAFFLRDYRAGSSKMDFSGFFKVVGNKHVVIFFSIILLVSIPHRMYEGFLAVSMRQMGASQSLIGLAWLASAASEIPILFLLGKYGHRFKELPLLALAALMYGIRFWINSQVSDPHWIIVTQFMHSVSFGIFFSTALRYISHMIPDEYRASGQAVFTVIWLGLAGALSGTFGGMLYEQLGRTAFFQTASVLGIAASAAFLLNHIWLNKKP